MTDYPEYRGATLEDAYHAHLKSGSAMAAHLPRLLELAKECTLAVEFGVKRGGSTCALLLGAERVLSVDKVDLPGVTAPLKKLAEGRWTFLRADTHTVEPLPCDLLLVDADHNYASVKTELERHADMVQRLLVFHDTITFGSFGADGESGRHKWTYRPGTPVPLEYLGIRPAVDELMIRDPSWRIRAHYTDSHGLLVLERRL